MNITNFLRLFSQKSNKSRNFDMWYFGDIAIFLHAFYIPKKCFLFSLCIQDKIYTFNILWCNIWNNLIIFYKIYIFQDIHSHIPYILCFFLQFLHFIQCLDFYNLNVYNFQTSCELVLEYKYVVQISLQSDNDFWLF